LDLRETKWQDYRKKKLINKELHNLYDSTNIIRVIKSRSMGLAENVERMEI